MGFPDDVVGLSLTRRYKRLRSSSASESDNEKLVAAAARSSARNGRARLGWVMKATLFNSGGGGLRLIKGLRLSRYRKLTLKAFSAMVFPVPRRISQVYGDIVEKIRNMDQLSHSYPNIIFSTHWGLPVLSHPLNIVKCSTTSYRTTTTTAALAVRSNFAFF